jgi:hypothetical protein
MATRRNTMRTTTTSMSNNHGATTVTNSPQCTISTPTTLTTLRPTLRQLDSTGSLRAITTAKERRKEQMKAGAPSRDASASRVPGTFFLLSIIIFDYIQIHRLQLLLPSPCHATTTATTVREVARDADMSGAPRRFLYNTPTLHPQTQASGQIEEVSNHLFIFCILPFIPGNVDIFTLQVTICT